MKMKLTMMLAAGLIASATASFGQNTPPTPAPAPTAAATTEITSTNLEVMPLITIEDAPLPDAIKTLARQAGINFQFDPKVLANTNAVPTVTFRWENVTALQALTAVLDNYGLQLSFEPKTKISRVTTKEAPGLEPLVTKVVSLHYSNPTNVIPIIKTVFGSARSQVISDSRTGQLVIVATEKEMSAINDILTRVDTSPSQILIEGRFIETVKNPKTAKGIDWTDTLAAQHFSGGNTGAGKASGIDPTDFQVPERPSGTPAGTLPPGTLPGFPAVAANTTRGFFSPFTLNAEGVKAVLSFLNSDNESQTLATPRAVALEGTPTELSVVQDIPIFEEQLGVVIGGAVAPTSVKPNYALKGPTGEPLNQIGVKLMVTPRIYGTSNVFLDLKPEISELGPEARTTLGGTVSTAPTFRRKKINTQAMVPSGNTLVLGGLRQDGTQQASTKVPILGDLPGLGAAFRSNSKERSKRDLLIFITPTIVAENDYQSGERSRDFLKKPAAEPADTEWSEWDSTKPHDWTKPVE